MISANTSFPLLLRAYLAPIFLVILTLFSCSHSSKVAEDKRQASLKKAVVFIPGFKGSRLEDTKSGRTIWLSFYEATLGSSSLTISRPEYLPQPQLEVRPTGVLNSVALIPRVFSRGLYGNFMNFLQNEFDEKAEVIGMAFDWRRSNGELAKLIEAKLRELRAKGFDEITVITHSMGGLGSAKLLSNINSSPQLTAEFSQLKLKFVFVGTPFHGVISVLSDLSTADSFPVGFNQTLISQRGLCSFESIYEFIPLSTKGELLDRSGETLDLDLNDANSWEANRLACFNGIKPADGDYRPFLEKQLIESRKLLTDINEEQEIQPELERSIKILSVTGSGLRTAEKCQLRSLASDPTLDCYANDLQGKGDTVVTEAASRLTPFLKGFPHEVKNFKNTGHLELLWDDDVQKVITEFVNKSD